MSIEDTKNMINALDTGDNVDTKRKDLAGTLLNKEIEADKESNVDVEPTEIDD